MLTKLIELIELIGLAELIKSTNQPPDSGFRVLGSGPPWRDGMCL